MDYNIIINELLADVTQLQHIQGNLININVDLALKLDTQIANLLNLIKKMQEVTL